MKREETSTTVHVVEMLAELASEDTDAWIAGQLPTLHELAEWRRGLPPVISSVSASSLCSNCHDHVASTQSQLEGSKPRAELWLEVETRCNLSCRFCYNFWRGGIRPEPASNKTDEFINGLHRILGVIDCELLTIAGGEPLLRIDLLEILAALRRYSIPTAIATNGVLLTPGKISELKERGVSTFQIPLHSHLAHVHDTLSAGQCWRKALQAIVWLRESGTQVVPVFVATAMNLSHFPRVVSLCRQIGLPQITFNRFVPTGQGAVFRDDVGVPTYEQISQTLADADRIAVSGGMTISLGVPIEAPTADRLRYKSVDWTSCPVYTGQRRWTIGADLKIRRCNSFETAIGSVFDDGLDQLVFELEGGVDEKQSSFRPCQILEAPKLVQIRSHVAMFLPDPNTLDAKNNFID